MSELSLDSVISMLNSTEEFPINLEDAWQWLGYSEKGKAKRTLVKNFEQGVDYIIQVSPDGQTVALPGFPAFTRQDVYLTVECFKAFGMLAGTAKGKEVRKYFLDCEKKLKEILKTQSASNRTNEKLLKAEIRKKHKTTYSHRRRVLREHGVHHLSQGWITRQDYQILFNMDTKQLRKNYGISKEELIVDHMETADQATLSFGHMMQTESLESKNIHDYYPVKHECGEVMREVVKFRNSLRSRANNIPELGGDS